LATFIDHRHHRQGVPETAATLSPEQVPARPDDPAARPITCHRRRKGAQRTRRPAIRPAEAGSSADATRSTLNLAIHMSKSRAAARAACRQRPRSTFAPHRGESNISKQSAAVRRRRRRRPRLRERACVDVFCTARSLSRVF